jgi:UDP-glucuronate 4-epimerase
MTRILGEEMGIEPRVRHLPMQPGDARRTFADIEKARGLWGYGPKWEFREGIREFVDWFRRG